MKTKLFIALTASLFAVSSCQKADLNPIEKNGQPSANIIRPVGFAGDCSAVQANLVTNENTIAGTVTSYYGDKRNIYVTFSCDNGYNLTETQLYVGDLQLIPVGPDGLPDPDNFPNITMHNNERSFTYIVDPALIAPGTCGVVSAHAKVINPNGSNVEVSAWANNNATGDSGTKDSFYFTFCSCQ